MLAWLIIRQYGACKKQPVTVQDTIVQIRVISTANRGGLSLLRIVIDRARYAFGSSAAPLAVGQKP